MYLDIIFFLVYYFFSTLFTIVILQPNSLSILCSNYSVLFKISVLAPFATYLLTHPVEKSALTYGWLGIPLSPNKVHSRHRFEICSKSTASLWTTNFLYIINALTFVGNSLYSTLSSPYFRLKHLLPFVLAITWSNLSLSVCIFLRYMKPLSFAYCFNNVQSYLPWPDCPHK